MLAREASSCARLQVDLVSALSGSAWTALVKYATAASQSTRERRPARGGTPSGRTAGRQNREQNRPASFIECQMSAPSFQMPVFSFQMVSGAPLSCRSDCSKLVSWTLETGHSHCPRIGIVCRPLPSGYSMTTDSTPIRTIRYRPRTISAFAPVERHPLPSGKRCIFLAALHRSVPMNFNGIGGGGGGGGGRLGPRGGGAGIGAPVRGGGGGGGFGVEPERIPRRAVGSGGGCFSASSRTSKSQLGDRAPSPAPARPLQPSCRLARSLVRRRRWLAGRGPYATRRDQRDHHRRQEQAEDTRRGRGGRLTQPHRRIRKYVAISRVIDRARGPAAARRCDADRPTFSRIDELRRGLERVDELAHVAIVAGQRIGRRQLRELAALLVLHGVGAVLEAHVGLLRELREPA